MPASKECFMHNHNPWGAQCIFTVIPKALQCWKIELFEVLFAYQHIGKAVSSNKCDQVLLRRQATVFVRNIA